MEEGVPLNPFQVTDTHSWYKTYKRKDYKRYSFSIILLRVKHIYRFSLKT